MDPTNDLQRCTKVITVLSGASAFLPTVNSTPQEARMAQSRCGRTAKVLLACGVHKINPSPEIRLDFEIPDWHLGVSLTNRNY